MSILRRRKRVSKAPRSRGRRIAAFAWRRVRTPLVLAVLFFAFVWVEKGVHAIRSATMSEAARLSEDLERLDRILLLEHPSPHKNGDPEAVGRALARAREAIEGLERGTLTKERVLAHFVEAVASVRDPHTSFSTRYETFGILRVQFALFGDELRIVAGPDSASLGARVWSFDGVPTSQVLERIRPLVPHANESGFLNLAPRFLRTPGLLHHVGAASAPDGVRLEVELIDGDVTFLALPRVSLDAFREAPLLPFPIDDEARPLYRRSGLGPYWFEALPDRDAVYIRYASSTSSSDRPLSDVTGRALHVRDSLEMKWVVVDVRGNSGGDPQAHIPLVAALGSTPAARGPATLRIITDRGTFSAGIVATSDLERRVGGLIVGEEPGDRAHLTTDPRPFTLRHSRVTVQIPTGLLHSPGGVAGRARLHPARTVAPTFEEWRAGEDPVLEAALEAEVDWDTLIHATAQALPEGRFAFPPNRSLRLNRDEDGYVAVVSGLSEDRLVYSETGVWAGGIHAGLRVDGAGQLVRRLPGGGWAVLPALDHETPLDLALAGRVVEASVAYNRLTANGSDRSGVASLGLVGEGSYLYESGNGEVGRALFAIASQLSPAEPLIPLQLSLLRREAEGRLVPPVGDFFRGLAACVRAYRQAELLNDWRLCL